MAIEKEELESTLGNLKMMFDQEKGKLIEVYINIIYYFINCFFQENEEILRDLEKNKEESTNNQRMMEDLFMKDRKLEEKLFEMQREIKEKNNKIDDKNQKLKFLQFLKIS